MYNSFEMSVGFRNMIYSVLLLDVSALYVLDLLI